MTEPQTETLYSPSYVAEALGVSAPQVRRWAAALETVTGQPIKQQPRTGRAYSQGQLDVLLKAKRIASAASGMSAETALSIALGQTGLTVPLARSERAPELSGLAFGPEQAQLIAEAITEAQQPLLAELRRLSEQLEQHGGLRAAQSLPERQGHTPDPVEAEQSLEVAQRPAGPLVRAAERIEVWLQRISNK